jgi:hypothetical protein
MASPIEAIVLLCDAAVADPAGKIHMLGAGWSITGSPTPPAAVAVMLKVPWDRANQKIPLSLKLFDADGGEVSVQGAKIGIEHTFEVGRPPGLAHGTSIDQSFQLSLGPMPLEPGRYQWRLDVGGTEVSTSFEVRASSDNA